LFIVMPLYSILLLLVNYHLDVLQQKVYNCCRTNNRRGGPVTQQDEEKRITIRMPRELYERLAAWAEREHRSLQGQLIHIVEHALPTSDQTEQPQPAR